MYLTQNFLSSAKHVNVVELLDNNFEVLSFEIPNSEENSAQDIFHGILGLVPQTWEFLAVYFFVKFENWENCFQKQGLRCFQKR